MPLMRGLRLAIFFTPPPLLRFHLRFPLPASHSGTIQSGDTKHPTHPQIWVFTLAPLQKQVVNKQKLPYQAYIK
jgi:hypothetical protein